jgi:hypothetical protein
MPGEGRLRLHDHDGRAPFSLHPGQPDPQETISPAEGLTARA